MTRQDKAELLAWDRNVRLARKREFSPRPSQNTQPVKYSGISSHDRMLRDKYGITAEEYDAILSSQGGLCAICTRPPGRRRLSVDHDHETGRVRGILCPRCNSVLGMVADSSKILHSAAVYLERE